MVVIMSKLFEELDETNQKKSIEMFREIERQDMCELEGDLQFKLEELLKENGIECEKPEVFYSLSSCQGDGVIFIGTMTWNNAYIEVTHSGRYTHAGSVDIEFPEFESAVSSGEAETSMRSKVHSFRGIYKEICVSLESFGYECIDNYLSDESIRENIIANAFKFEIKDPDVFYI